MRFLYSEVGEGRMEREDRLHIPMFRAAPPIDSPLAKHCRMRAEAALRSWARLACAIVVSGLAKMAWKKQRARSTVSIESQPLL